MEVDVDVESDQLFAEELLDVSDSWWWMESDDYEVW